MDSKYMLLLVMACSQNLVISHILPGRSDYPLTECVKTLTRHMMNLCSTYEDYHSEFFDNGMPPLPREVATRRWELSEGIIQACCIQPCSAAELLSIC